ncbi:hypothetical protein E1211_25785 [Micromonospora sp. 15K316]|uniref:hypothetical protein n=1 Tax=Micromonospora sp. 15K316 TaxID=2530376 RepID=UPI0010495B28|nr:hypothetical protein [Micromonospora sp. 15K316]TDC29570.1 hypothetical protein E1211_25785 [Micromonospora sp. 15K316]
MIEAIVSAALLKIAEGSGAALVEAIRQRFTTRDEPDDVVRALDRTAEGAASAEDTARLGEVLARYAAEDPELLRALRHASAPAGATNTVHSSDVGKLIQAQHVGDVTM